MSAGLLPNVIIVGAPKSATSTVFAWLADHPDALGSTRKETDYFVDIDTHMYEKRANFLHHGLDRYRRYFPHGPGKLPRVVIESTPAYMYYQNALDNLEHLETKPLFLFVLREPSRQIYSLFQYFRNNGNWVPRSMSFADYLAAVRQGTHAFKGNELAQNAIQYAKYVAFLLRWRDRYGANSLRSYLFEDLLTDERGFIQRVATALGLDPDFYDNYDFARENETYEPRLGVCRA